MTQNVLRHSRYDPSGLSWHQQSCLYENDKPACLSHQQAAAKKKQSIGSSHRVPVISSKRKMKPAVRIVGSLSDNMSALDLQAATGLLAVIVLLVIMNWFFHKIYWGGWIRAHNRRRKALLENARGAEISQWRLWCGLILLGFTSLYREGFEVVLFLQSYHLRLGGGVVLKGALLGLMLTGMVAVLTFVLQQRLPYRKMLITTGILLGVVLLVMVGEQAQEMQLAHWISTTPINSLKDYMPPWMGLWFAVFPTVETLVAQLIAAVLVIGSYFAAKRFGGGPGGAAVEAHAPSMAAINA